MQPSSQPPSDQQQPRSLANLFVAFSVLALQGFGGVAVVAQHELVERHRWMTNEEFVEEWAVAQIMPGPNVVNMSLMIGARSFGVPGALAALAGLLSIPLVLVLLLALVYSRYAGHPDVMGAMRGMGAVAAGLIFAMGLKLSRAMKTNPLGIPLCIALGSTCFIGTALLRWPLVYVLVALGAVSCLLTYWRLKP